MKRSSNRLLAGGVIAIPAILFLIYVLVSFRGAYYFSTYTVVGIVFVIASFSVGLVVTQKITPEMSSRRMILLLFLGSVAAWGMALLVLAVLSVTPLCVGQDNGDGNNDLGMCGFYVVLAAVFYSVPMVILMGVASGVAGGLLRWRRESRSDF